MRTCRSAALSRIRASHLVAACVAAALASGASAAITYVPSSSSVTITHDANTSSGGVDKTVSLAPPTSSSMTSFQMNNTIGSTTQSIAKGSIGSVTNPTTATFSLSSGTGVTQVDPTHVWGNSSLKFTINGVWNTGATAFGPTSTGYFSMGYGGTVGGAGSSAQVKINISFVDNNNVTLRSPISFTDTITAAGTFGKTYTSSVPMTGGTVGANKQVKVTGTIEFLANNDGGPVDLSPLNFESGGAPPTATWVNNGSGNFNDPANWNGTGPNFIVEPGSTIPTLPNSAGDRARIVNVGSAPGGTRTITVPASVTLGTLDIDDDDAVIFQPTGGGALNFSTLQGNAVIRTGNSQGTSSIEVQTPVTLGTGLTVAVESDSPLAARAGSRTPGTPNGRQGLLNISAPISGSNGITSVADGTVALTGVAANTFTGGMHSTAGYVDASKIGALGTGTATAQDSQLNYNVSGAANPATVTQITSLGEISIKAGNIAPSDRASIGDLAAIEASSTVLSQFNTNAAGGTVNLQLSPGAMIAHRTFDPDLPGNPQGLNPTSPLYVFGVSQFFGNSAITVGSDSSSPWRGFGGPRGNFTFGDAGLGQVGIAGNAELVSLRGTMRIASQLVAVGPTVPSITIRGGGIVIIDSPSVPFAGNVTVESGTLAITSGWTPQSITVLPGGSMGGSESNAPLTINNGGHISPGDNGGFQSIGTFHAAQSLTLDNLTVWDFDLDVPNVVGGPNDLLTVDGPIILDGILNVNGLENFGVGVYTIALFGGSVTNNVVELGMAPPDYSYEIICQQSFVGSSKELLLIVSAVPEPASIGMVAVAGLMLARRARRNRV